MGVEFYYTGVQRLEENPFADISKPYVIVGLLAERQFGQFRLFVNGENLTGFGRPDEIRSSVPAGRQTVDGRLMPGHR